MTPDLFRRVEGVFSAARGLAPDAREQYLADVCADEPDLRAEVAALLAHDSEPEPYLKTPAIAAGLHFVSSALSPEGLPLVAVPERIGAYRILRVVGEGGFGTVYLAEQDSPRRTVAVKVIKAHIASPQMLRRFEYEAQVLGRLQHPGIAQIHEAGTTAGPHGVLAFFALEYVRGVPLDEYAKNNHLSTRERLGLFARVCDAVQYAHQMGVIHRDLKPPNILVDNQGQPKILDFGVARTTDSNDQLTAVQTSAGQLVGTLPYMSPEQVGGASQGVDTRSDVYALGVVLYQLLTERLPIDVQDCTLPEAVRRIHEQPPVRTSAINRTLRGEIETILAKALDKDRTRRYQSALQLASDIRRYLAGEPIEAKRDSTLYVLRATLRRYRKVVWTAVVFSVLLAIFSVTAAIQAERSRRLAAEESAARREAQLALQRAENERRRADESAAELTEQLSRTNIERGRLLGLSGNMPAAEDLLWSEYLRHPSSTQARWALWELYSEHPCLLTMLGHTASVSAVAVAPDGRLAASGSADRMVFLWDLQTGTARAALHGHTGPISSVAFSPDGQLLASGSEDGTARVWSVASGDCLAVLSHPGDHLQCVDFAPDGRFLVTAGVQATLYLWDVDTFTLVQTVPTGHGAIRGVKFDPAATDGPVLATAGDDSLVRLWQLDTGATCIAGVREVAVLQGHTDNTGALAFTPEGRWLASGSRDRTIHLWELPSGTCVGVIRPKNGTIRALAFSADGQTLAAGGWWTIDLYDRASRELRNSLAIQAGVASLAWGPDGCLVCADASTGDSSSTHVHLWEVTPNRCLQAVNGHGGRVVSVAVSPDGQTAASVGQDRRVHLWDIAGRRELRVFDPPAARLAAVLFSPDGRTLVTASRDGVLRLWDVATGELRALMNGFAANGEPLAFAPDGKTLVSGRADGVIVIWDVVTGRELTRIDGAGGEVLAACFSPDGRVLATTSRDRHIHLWDAETHALLGTLQSPDQLTFWCLAISPDSRTLAAGTWGRTIELWDLATRQRVGVLEGHNQLVTKVAYEPSGHESLLASASNDGLIKLWDPQTKQCLATLNGRGGDVYSVALTPGGRTLVSGSEDGGVGFWDLAYYDRHIAGNALQEVQGQTATLGSAADVSRIRTWAADLQTRVWSP